MKLCMNFQIKMPKDERGEFPMPQTMTLLFEMLRWGQCWHLWASLLAWVTNQASLIYLVLIGYKQLCRHSSALRMVNYFFHEVNTFVFRTYIHFRLQFSTEVFTLEQGCVVQFDHHGLYTSHFISLRHRRGMLFLTLPHILYSRVPNSSLGSECLLNTI